MNYETVDSSPQMRERGDEYLASDRNAPTTRFPFNTMQIGQSFLIPFGDMKEQSVRVLASQAQRFTGKAFRVIKHPEHGFYEVGRIL